MKQNIAFFCFSFLLLFQNGWGSFRTSYKLRLATVLIICLLKHELLCSDRAFVRFHVFLSRCSLYLRYSITSSVGQYVVALHIHILRASFLGRMEDVMHSTGISFSICIWSVPVVFTGDKPSGAWCFILIQGTTSNSNSLIVFAKSFNIPVAPVRLKVYLIASWWLWSVTWHLLKYDRSIRVPNYRKAVAVHLAISLLSDIQRMKPISYCSFCSIGLLL